MIITCPECDTKYRYDERRFDGAVSKRVKCTSCSHTFEVANPTRPSPPADLPRDRGRFSDVAAGAAAGPELELEIEPEPATGPITEQPSAPDRDLDGPLPPLPTDPRYSLAVIAGGQAGSVYQIHKPRVYLGRGSAMDIQLRDSEVSRRHAMIEIRDPDVTLTDLASTNGTWFGGAQIASAELGHQDEFTLGSTTLMLIVTPVRGA
ncbi:MAG: zinc-ribbon domain-containing protein [Thermoanaerobaculales bacterium]|nr:zinc-ribbon domain-containing protein [Thermoanaerobaculales bacterium]